ncbi:toxin-antitoxin system HicB family antitoxin [Streptomyces sp. NPDC059517]|uniref:toxin-antitoxin system HicB family antitoxin n=1 Tax=Streptomyces sp. NPDC059517 TaxID=3346855 RepID=UPI00368127EC
MSVMMLRIPDELGPSIKAAANAASLSLNAYIVRAVRRQSVLDAAQQLAALGLGDTLCGDGDIL